jgi:hypothetical protein
MAEMQPSRSLAFRFLLVDLLLENLIASARAFLSKKHNKKTEKNRNRLYLIGAIKIALPNFLPGLP